MQRKNNPYQFSFGFQEPMPNYNTYNNPFQNTVNQGNYPMKELLQKQNSRENVFCHSVLGKTYAEDENNDQFLFQNQFNFPQNSKPKTASEIKTALEMQSKMQQMYRNQKENALNNMTEEEKLQFYDNFGNPIRPEKPNCNKIYSSKVMQEYKNSGLYNKENTIGNLGNNNNQSITPIIPNSISDEATMPCTMFNQGTTMKEPFLSDPEEFDFDGSPRPVIPPEKQNDEQYKLLKIRRQLKRPGAPGYKSARKYGDEMASYEKEFKSTIEYSILKKKRASLSAKKIYSSTIALNCPNGQQKFFPIYSDRDIGISGAWQEPLIESNQDEDVDTDNEGMAISKSYIVSELKEAFRLIKKEGFRAVNAWNLYRNPV